MDRRIRQGYTKHPESVACYSVTCGHRSGGDLDICKRAELAATRRPQLGDLHDPDEGRYCLHAVLYPLGTAPTATQRTGEGR